MRDQRDALLVLLLLLLLLLVIVWPQCDLVLARHLWNGLWDAGRRCGDRRTRLGAAICIADAARHGDGAHCAALHWRTVHSQRRRGWSAWAEVDGARCHREPVSRTSSRTVAGANECLAGDSALGSMHPTLGESRSKRLATKIRSTAAVNQSETKQLAQN